MQLFCRGSIWAVKPISEKWQVESRDKNFRNLKSVLNYRDRKRFPQSAISVKEKII